MAKNTYKKAVPTTANIFRPNLQTKCRVTNRF